MRIIFDSKLYPQLGIKYREFKKKKRKEYKLFKKQLQKLSEGIALTNDDCYNEFKLAQKHLDKMEKFLRLWWKNA